MQNNAFSRVQKFFAKNFLILDTCVSADTLSIALFCIV
jgi:hypothetical protein